MFQRARLLAFEELLLQQQLLLLQMQLLHERRRSRPIQYACSEQGGTCCDDIVLAQRTAPN